MAQSKKSSTELTEQTQSTKRKRFAYGSQTWETDRFELLSAKKLVMNGWKPEDPMFEQVDHVHQHYTKDRHGKDSKYCRYAMSHTHEVEVTWDDDGHPHLKVGPPLVEKAVKTPRGGTKKILVPIRYKVVGNNGDDVDESGMAWRVDNHTHDFKDMGTQEISTQLMKSIQDANQVATKNMITWDRPNQTGTMVEEVITQGE